MKRNRIWHVAVALATAALSAVSADAQTQAPEPPQSPATTAPAQPSEQPPAQPSAQPPAQPSEQPPAQSPAATAQAPATASSLDQFAWLRGCWAGKADRFEFIEQWSAPRAGMMVGVSQMTVQDRQQAAPPRTADYSYLRLEARPDGVYYAVIPSGKKESAFKFDSVRAEEGGHMAYTFKNSGEGFPERIVYVKGARGWLYARVQGKAGGQAKDITYPMRRVDCVTGAFIED